MVAKWCIKETDHRYMQFSGESLDSSMEKIAAVNFKMPPMFSNYGSKILPSRKILNTEG